MSTPAAHAVPTREIDWRFLLPRPSGAAFDHLVLLGGSPAVERTILDLGVARRVSNTLRPGVSADVVIGLAGSTASLDDAAAALNEGGVLYWEVDRRERTGVALSPSRANRCLERHGLNVCASYWVKPGFPKRQMYVPLNCRGALRWYLQTLFRTPTRLRRMAKTALAAAAECCGLSAIAPCYAITAVRGELRFPAVVERARAEGLAISRHAQAVFLAHGSTEWNRIVVLLFEPDGRTPVAAIKLPRTARFNREIDWEHEILRELASDLSPSLAATIPHSTIFQWNGLSVSTETCVPGASLNCRVRPAAEGAISDFRRVVDWLAAFHRHTTSERVPAREWGRRVTDELLREYADTFGLTPAEARLFDAFSSSIATLKTETLPIVRQHGDLGPPNLYIHDEDVFAIDWETARRGPALEDLLYLAADWTAAVTRRSANQPENFESLYCKERTPGTFAHAVHDEIARYMRLSGVPSTLLPFLLVSTFVSKALERAHRLRRLGDAGATLREGNRFVPCVGLLAEHPTALTEMPGSISEVRAEDVTVAIATNNRPAMLGRCVEAILAAPTLPAELVIVDQSADMETERLVKTSAWSARLPVSYIRQPRRGLAASRNAAIANASHPIVAFTDDDCVPEERWLESMLSGFNAPERPDAVTGRVLPLGPSREGFYAVSTRAGTVPAVYRERTLPWVVGSGGNTAVQRQWLIRVGGFDERLGAGSSGKSAEDMDLLHRLLRNGAAVRYEPAAVVYHERQTADRRLASRESYGFGMGAFCGLWIHRRDSYAFWMLSRWCCDRGRALAAACVRRRWRRVREESLMLKGVLRGLGYALSHTQNTMSVAGLQTAVKGSK